MLPVDADGNPLMNGVLYGVDTRAAREIEDLTNRIGADRILDICGNALTSQSARAEDPLAQEQPAGHLCRSGKDRQFDHLHRPAPDRQLRCRPLYRREHHSALRC
jgi:hypothetical protein